MPKIVDHDERRLAIVHATWRLIAAKGFRATTMREIAKASGVANGGLFPYFRNKEELIGATFEHVFAATNERFAAVRADLVGLPALHALMLQIFPLDEERLLEARIVIPFWEVAANEPELLELHERTMARWRVEIADHLDTAKALGQIRGDVDVALATDHFMAMLDGVQVIAVLSPANSAPERLTRLLDGYLELLR
ncbi:TetR family transcriptional regulator [Agromyces tardus]|jgi:AcrR family transcriptional regulator|uniref:TetR family transcriptional regulator n=1 Tax=Agromyces tardus TaxID=2583849 RepID=A0A3M8A620_9MICO|nr:TetR/AcrR family transcriptional regulator [Agromyces tardus]RNB46451.1 TetR family transcriptional regulator [Agromyces tardus]